MLGVLDVKRHGLLAGLDQDDHLQYLLINGTRAMTGTLFTQAVRPVATDTYDQGSDAYRFRRTHAQQLRNVSLIGGTPPVITQQAPIYGGAVIGSCYGTGVKNFIQNNRSLLAMGYVYAPAGGVATIEASRAGAVAWGNCFAVAASSNIRIAGSGFGSTSTGYASGQGTVAIDASGLGSFTRGYASANIGATANMLATGNGAFASGRINAYTNGGTAYVTSGAAGAFASGSVISGSNLPNTGVIAGGAGSFASGACYGGSSSGARIRATLPGSFAQGYTSTFGAYAGIIEATNRGGFAQGYAYAGIIRASGRGSFAQGYASYGINVIASGTNSVQFGYGTNSLANSLQVGSAGLRFKGSAGAPATPQNGDHWVQGGYVYIRSNGVSVKIV